MSKLHNSTAASFIANAQRRFTPILVLTYQIFGLIIFAILPILAVRWLSTPYIGALVEHTLFINTSSPTTPGTWELAEYSHQFGLQIQAIDGQPVTTNQQMLAVLSQHQVGDQVSIALRNLDGTQQTAEITLSTFPQADQFYYLYLPYLIGLVYLACGLWVFTLRRQNATGRAFAIFSTSVAIGIAGQFDIVSSNNLTPIWTLVMAVIPAALLNLALLFPQESSILSRYPWLAWIGYPVSALLAVYALPTIYNYANPAAYVAAWRAEYIAIGIAGLVFITVAGLRYFQPNVPVVRSQARLELIGSGLAFGPLILWFLITSINPQVRFSPILLAPVIIFPIITAYTILRYRLLRTDYIFSRAIVYSLLFVLVSASYALLVSGIGLIFGSRLLSQNPILLGIILFGLALIFSPLRGVLQDVVDKAFARSTLGYRDRLQTFGRSLTQAMDLPAIIQQLRQNVQETLQPIHLHIFTYDPLIDQYIVLPSEGNGKPSSDLRFAGKSALVKVLSEYRSSIFIGEGKTTPAALQADKARVALLGSQLYVPLPGRQRLSGWMALGQRRSGEPFNDRDLEFLEALSDQAALALERAQVVADLERRVQAMNILTRVSQGINITLAIDDILELIYTQANQVVETHDFHITLFDKVGNFLYYVFYLENDERIPTLENRPIPYGQGIEREVVSTRRQLLTDDYESECRRRGVLPTSPGLYSWVGVPLNTGAECIGVLSMGSRDPAVIYTAEQVDLLQAIADQAAGAIVKARLLEESERRTHQLTTLNEVARSLASTLELDSLLNQILNSAVEMLNCEAGSLILVDSLTGELVYSVVVSPIAGDQRGQRLPPGTGLPGKVVESRLPIILNDVQRNKEWQAEIDQSTGFTTNNLLIVPLLVKEQVIGVIEVFNHKDGFPFTQDDQDMLSAFTSQAAVAIDNARLYTQTDQNLAFRVEELSVMQRIDRELNASLDISRALNITLDWAMRQSGADAGLVGILEGAEVKIMASQGYPSEFSDLTSIPHAHDFASIRSALETGQPSFNVMEAATSPASTPAATFLVEGKNQLVVPIRREATVIGIVVLESRSTDSFSEEIGNFLTRLSDHAAIAISNAQLYHEVQEANLAKSDFVSFVSHELKTPMTSIRGFTDLLAAGVVGSVNEAQNNFLTTIRSNVDRMATLVSDLADVSRIEAGRLRLDFSELSMAEMLEEIARSNRNLFEGKQQKLTINLPPDLPPLWGDRNRLIQVLTNLINNAHKYTPAGGEIIVTAELVKPEIGEGSTSQMVRVAVKDNGFGISPEDQAKIFQKFFRAEDQKVRDTPGTGLGLNITKTLVEMQGGQIWFESELDKGTTFYFTAPIAEK